MSARNIVSLAISSAQKEGTAHMAVSVSSSGGSETISQDSAVHSGRQQIAIGADNASIVVIGKTTYIEGSAGGLSQYFSYPTTVAIELAGFWISYGPKDPGYSVISSGVTLSAALGQLRPTSALRKLGPSVVDGKPVFGVSGTEGADSVTLYVSANGDPLPVAATETSGTSSSSTVATISTSDWHERLALRPPSHSVAISSITTTKPQTSTTATAG
jgi:hypothetical protein